MRRALTRGLLAWIFSGLALLGQEIPDPAFHSYTEIQRLLDSLADAPQYSSILRVIELGRTGTENLPIRAVRLSFNPDSTTDEPAILFLGPAHAEEILGIEICLGLIDTLLHGYDHQIPHVMSWLENLDIWIVPTYNPEGLRVVFQGLDLTYRKNKTDTNGNGVFDYTPGIGWDIDGVDLNRNYDFNWIHGDDYLEGDYDYYRGPAPFSEKETQAIRDLALSRHFAFSVAYHSARSGTPEIIYYPWEWDVDKHSADFPVIDAIAQELASRIENEAGNGHYATHPGATPRGNAHDWFYARTGCFQYLIEVGTNNLQPDSAIIRSTVERNLAGCFYLLDRLLGYPPESQARLEGHIVDAVTGVPIEGAVVKLAKLGTDGIYHSWESPWVTPRRTDRFGRFRRLALPGMYRLRIEAPGYATAEFTSVPVSDAYPTAVDIPLTALPEKLFFLDLQGDPTLPIVLVIQDSAGTDTMTLTTGLYQFSRRTVSTRIFLQQEGHFPLRNTFEFQTGDTLRLELPPAQQVFSTDFSDLYGWQGDGGWVIADGVLKTQEELFYPNDTEQSLRSQAFSIAGMVQVGVFIRHRWELEWGRDSVVCELYSTGGELLHRWKWTGTDFKWRNQWRLATVTPVDSAFLVLRLGADGSLPYRGWELDSLVVWGTSEPPVGLGPEPRSLTENQKPLLSVSAALPNPFRNRIQFRITTPRGGPGRLQIFDLRGRQLLSIAQTFRAGVNRWTWDRKDQQGRLVPAGVYLLRVQQGTAQSSRKILVLNATGGVF